MQYVPWIAKLIQFGGLALMAMTFSPLGEGRRGLLRHPWFLAYGIVVFVLGSLAEVAFMSMMRP